MADIISFPKAQQVPAKKMLPAHKLPRTIDNKKSMRKYLKALADHFQNSGDDYSNLSDSLRYIAKIHMSDATFYMLKAITCQYGPLYIYDSPFNDNDHDMIDAVVDAIINK